MRRMIVAGLCGCAGLVVAIAIVAYPHVGAAQVPQSVLGTWKMNVAKSTYSPGPAPRSTTSHWETMPGGGAKGVVETVDVAGRSFHYELVTMFDGKEAEYKGASAPTTRAYSRIDDRTYQYVERVNGKVTTTNRVTMAADGKTRTQVTTGTGAGPRDRGRSAATGLPSVDPAAADVSAGR